VFSQCREVTVFYSPKSTLRKSTKSQGSPALRFSDEIFFQCPRYVEVAIRSGIEKKRKIRPLELEGLGLLPGEALIGEMAILGRLEVYWVDKIEILDNNTRAKVEVIPNDFDKFI